MAAAVVVAAAETVRIGIGTQQQTQQKKKERDQVQCCSSQSDVSDVHVATQVATERFITTLAFG